ncbi:PIN-like domain-containing protein [Streptomyces sp. NPDC004721]
MRFFLDENETPAILPPLSTVFFHHEFRTAHDEGLSGVMDTELIHAVSDRGFDAIMTQDRNQLSNRDERDALIETSLHWIGHRQPDADGLLYIVNSTAAYLAAMPHILDEMSNVTGAHAFHVRNLPLLKGQRVTVSRLKT